MPFTPYTLPISLTAVATGGGVTPKSMSGLRNKTVYNSSGTSYTTPSSGPFSLKDNLLNRSFTAPYTVPNIVNPISATAGNAQVTLSWSAPNDGGSAITGYTLTYSPGGSTPTNLPATPTSYIVTGLTNGTAYTFTMTANNIAGSSAPNSSGSSVPYTVPNIVNPISATAGDSQVSLSWSEPNNGGLAITGYTLTYSPGGSTPINLPATPTSYIVTGLTNGTAYTFTLTAINNAGSSAPNSSDSVRLNYVVTTLAGGGTAGFANGTGTNALFNEPWGVAVNNSGDVIVSDTNNNCIRKVTNPGGVVTTLAGSVTGGFADGTGSGAAFNLPYGVTIDNNGNAIVADAANGYIRKVTSAGVVTTLPGGSIQMTVMNVAVDANGNIIYSEYYGHRIRKLTPGGAVTTLAGSGTAGFANGTGTGAVINQPWGVTIDTSGNIIFSDSGNYRIRKINITTLEVTTLAGSGNGSPMYVDGTGDTASFSTPAGLAIDNNGNVIVADYYGNSIRKVTNPGGVVTTLVERGTFMAPFSVAIDKEGKIIVGDASNNRICKIS